MRYLMALAMGWSLGAQDTPCTAPDGCKFLRHGMSVFIGFPVGDGVTDYRRGQRFFVVEPIWGMEGAASIVSVQLERGPGGSDELRTKPGEETIVPKQFLVAADRYGSGEYRQSGCLRAIYPMEDFRAVQLLKERALGARVTLKGNAHVNYPWKLVSGVTIRLESEDGAQTAISDSQGNFWFQGLAPGRYRVSLNSTAYEMDSTRREIVVLPGGCGDLSLNLVPKTLLQGRLLYSDGSVGAKLPVSILQANAKGAPSSHLQSYHQLTDSRGRFEFRNVMPGKYFLGTNLAGGAVRQIFAVPTTYYPGSFEAETAEAIELRHGETPPRIEYRLPDLGRRRRLTVEVVTEDGKPFAGAEIESRLHPKLGGTLLESPGRTNESGIAEFEIWPMAIYSLWAHDWPRSLLSVPKDDDNVVQKGEGPVRLRLVLVPRGKQ